MSVTNNLSYIQLFGNGISAEGRTASEQESGQILQWLKSCRATLSTDMRVKSADIEDPGEIIIHYIGCKPMEIRAFDNEYIEVIDPMGDRSILIQPELRVFIDGLT